MTQIAVNQTEATIIHRSLTEYPEGPDADVAKALAGTVAQAIRFQKPGDPTHVQLNLAAYEGSAIADRLYGMEEDVLLRLDDHGKPEHVMQRLRTVRDLLDRIIDTCC